MRAAEAQNAGVNARLSTLVLLLAGSVIAQTPDSGIPPAENQTPSVLPPQEEPQPAPQPAPQEEPQPAPQPAPQEEPQPAPQPTPQEEQALPAEDISEAYRGIVKVEVSTLIPNYEKPWQTGHFGRGTGTGFLVAPGLFMTNAHVVANARRIYISLYADARKIPARVKHVAHDADLALLEVSDTALFQSIPCLEFSEEPPQLEDTVRAIGYPIGGNRLSVTRGIVSRIDTIPYAHQQNISHMALQVDAAINPGNSGGPVLKGNKVIGVAFQGLMRANSTGYVIPVSIIRHFLKDVEDGHYDGFINTGAQFTSAENPALRSHHSLPDDGMGCLVADVAKDSSCDGVLQAGDIVLEANGHPVDCSAMIELNGVRIRVEELAKQAFAGEKMQFRIRRNGEEQMAEATLKPFTSGRILQKSYDRQPRYVSYAGLIFQPLEHNVITAHSIPIRNVMVEMDAYIRGGASASRQDIVVLTSILPDELNARFNHTGRGIVTKVNGIEVKGLEHLHTLLYPADGQEAPKYTTIELADAPRPLVIDSAAAQAATERISRAYNIPAPARLTP